MEQSRVDEIMAATRGFSKEEILQYFSENGVDREEFIAALKSRILAPVVDSE